MAEETVGEHFKLHFNTLNTACLFQGTANKARLFRDNIRKIVWVAVCSVFTLSAIVACAGLIDVQKGL